MTRCCLGTTLLAPAPANVGTAMGDDDSRRCWPETAVTGTGSEHEDEDEVEVEDDDEEGVGVEDEAGVDAAAAAAVGWRMWRSRERPEEEEGEVLASTGSFFAEEAMVCVTWPLRPDHNKVVVFFSRLFFL